MSVFRNPFRRVERASRRTSSSTARVARWRRAESLEERALLAGDVALYHNAANPTDVNNDGIVSLNDALIVVQELRAGGPRQLTLPTARGAGEADAEGEGGGLLGLVDVNGDNILSLHDALLVVTALRGEGEGQAIADEFTITENSVGNTLLVLQNDISDPGDTLTISRISVAIDAIPFIMEDVDTPLNTAVGSTLTISNDRQFVIYTPRPGFFGEERFFYTLNDGNFGETEAQVTLTVRPDGPAVRLRLEASTIANPNAGVASVDQGEEFFLNVYVRDLRTDFSPAGSLLTVAAAYLDVLYDQNAVSIVAANPGMPALSDLTFGTEYNNPGFNDASFAPGLINEAGSVWKDFNSTTAPLLGGGEFLLFRARFRADAAGNTTIAGDHPDLPGNAILVMQPPQGTNVYVPTITPDQFKFVVEFVDASLTINPSGTAQPDSFPRPGDPPIFEDSTNNILDVLANDEPGATVISVTPTGSQGGLVSVQPGGGAVIYTPAPDFFGVETFVYTIDGPSGTDSATVSVTVTNVNDPPTAVNDTFGVPFNSGPRTLDVLANDSNFPDPPSTEQLTIIGVSTPSGGGTVSIAPGGQSLLYTPPAGIFVTETFTYTISDGAGPTSIDTATVTIIGGVFDDIVRIRLATMNLAMQPITSVEVGQSFLVGMFVDDLRVVTPDPDIGPGVGVAFIDLLYTSTVVTAVPGSVVYGPIFENLLPPGQANSFGVGRIDRLGGTHENLTDGPINGTEEHLVLTVQFTANASGTATFTPTPTGELGFGVETFDPAEVVSPDDVDFVGTSIQVTSPMFDETVRIRVQTSNLAGVPQSVVQVGSTFFVDVFVQDVRAMSTDPLVGLGVATAYIDLLYQATNNAVQFVPGSVTFGPLYNDFTNFGGDLGNRLNDVGATQMDVANGPIQGGQEHLLFRAQFSTSNSGQATFTSAPTNNLLFNIATFDIPDGVPLADILFESATITIGNLADIPIANNDTYSTPPGQTLVVPAPGVLANDVDPNNDPLTAILVTGVQNGVLTLNANGSFTYIPAAGFQGVDSFTYRAFDGLLSSAPATVTINVSLAAGPALANPDVYTTPLNTTLNVNAPTGVLANDQGVGLTAVVVAGTGPTNGALSFNANGSFTYTPNTGFVGVDTFQYRITDSMGVTSTATVTLAVGIQLSNISGLVYVDYNNNNVYEPNLYERPVGGVTVTLKGTAVGGLLVEQAVVTNSAGAYSFSNLLPGVYTITESQPQYLLDGRASSTLPGATFSDVNQNDIVSFTLAEGVTATANFGQFGIHPHFFTIRDMLASTSIPGFIVANTAVGTQLWHSFLEGWAGWSAPTITLNASGSHATITARNAGGVLHTVTLPTSGDLRLRYMGIRPGEGYMMRIEGTPLDLFFGGAAGEAEGEAAVDAVFASGW